MNLRERNEQRIEQMKNWLGNQYILHPSQPKAKWGYRNEPKKRT